MGEVRLADILANRSTNIQKHKAEIHARPERQWIMSNKDKRKLKEENQERIKQLAGAAAEGEAPAEEEKEQGGGGKRRKGDEKGKKHIDKKAQRTMDRIKAEKDAIKKERLESERRVRASARRQKTAAKPGAKPQDGGA